MIPKIFKEEQGAHGEKGEFARLSAFIGGISVADLVKTTLGPKGAFSVSLSLIICRAGIAGACRNALLCAASAVCRCPASRAPRRVPRFSSPLSGPSPSLPSPLVLRASPRCSLTGMDKILQSMSGKRATITNDGATILKAMPADNPSAKIIVDTSITQDAEVGDGTTTVAVLAGELLREAEKLILAQIHPQIVLKGWRMALDVAREALKEAAEHRPKDDAKVGPSDSYAKYSRKLQGLGDAPSAAAAAAAGAGAVAGVPHAKLLNIARTTLSSKILATEDDFFAKMAVQAVLRLKDNFDLNMIQVVKKLGGNLRDSYLDEGFILDKKFGVGSARKIVNAKYVFPQQLASCDDDLP